MIKELKVLDEVYFSEDDEKRYSLKERILPVNHKLKLGKPLYLIVGDNGIGKSTFLKKINESINSYLSFKNNYIGKKNHFPLFNDWKGGFDIYNFQRYFNLPVFNERIFKDHRESRERILIERVTRNVSQLNKKKLEYLLPEIEKRFGKSKIESLNRMAYIVECGINILHTPYPQTIFCNYELSFDKVEPNIIFIDYSHAGLEKSKDYPYDLELLPEYKGLNEGEKVMKSSKNLEKRSNKNSIFLLDEPTRSLSAKNSKEIGERIKKLQGQKFIATHDGNLINSLKKEAEFINFYKKPIEVTKEDVLA